MQRTACAVVLVVLAGAASAGQPARPARGPALKKLRVLMAVDSGGGLADLANVNGSRLVQVLSNHVPAGQLDAVILTGEKATREAILDHYRDLKTGPDEALLFFYGGGAAIHPK